MNSILKNLLGAVLVSLMACSSDTQTAGGADDFPNSVASVLAQGLSQWGENRSLRPDQEGVLTEEVASSQSMGQALAKTALAKTSGIDTTGLSLGRVTVFSVDTLPLRIVLDTAVIAWDSLAQDNIPDNERVYYYSRRTVRRLTGAYEYQRITPLDTFIRAPLLDSMRLQMYIERDNWRTGVLDQSQIQERVDLQLVHFPSDTLKNYPLMYTEELRGGDQVQTSRLLTAQGGTMVQKGQPMLLQKLFTVAGDSVLLQEVGIDPGEKPWHGSALSRTFRSVDYAPANGWIRTEMYFAGYRGYAEGEEILEGTFQLTVVRDQGVWVVEGTFDPQKFQGQIVGPDGRAESVSFPRD